MHGGNATTMELDLGVKVKLTTTRLIIINQAN